MTTDDRFRREGEPSGPSLDPSEVESEFDCPRCGVTRTSTDVGYDVLGYPVCPACGFESQ
ncbi:MAG: hypothetical protein ABEI75_03650 [Halobaculum sp.]